MVPMAESQTYWHLCTPDKHKTDCSDTISLTATRPKMATGVLVIEFHPPTPREEGNQQVPAEDALRWPHVISYQ